MTDCDDFLFVCRQHLFAHHLDEEAERLFARDDLGKGDESAVVVDGQHGFDVQRAADERLGFADPSGALEVLDVVDCEKAGAMRQNVFDIGDAFVIACALVAFEERVVGGESFDEACGLGVDDGDAPFGELKILPPGMR